MAVDRYQNSTAYEHPQESNLLNIHKAMKYNALGEPQVRVHVDGISLEGDVIVDTVSLSSSTLAALESINVQNTVSVTVSNFPTTSTVYQGTIPWATTITNWPALQYVNGTLYAVQSGTWSVGVTGSVTVTNFTSTVNVASLPAISGTVAVSSLPAITGTVSINNSVTITNTSFAVTNFPTTSTVYQGTSPWVITGTVAATLSTSTTINILPDATAGDFYGEPYAVSITPVVQTYGVYGTNTRDHQIYTSGGGSVNTVDSSFQVASSSTVGSYAVFRSRRFNTHKPGQTLLARFYSKFDTPRANTSQRVGVQNQQDAYYIGYNGLQFGVVHIHGGKVPLYKLTVNSYTGGQKVTVTLNNVAYTATIVVSESTNLAAERIARAISTATTTWLCESVDNYVNFLYTGGLAPLSGTFSATGSGTFSGTFTTLQAGVAATNDWYYAGTDFNLPLGFDNEGYNQWQIKYSWPGVKFYVLDQATGRYVQFYNHYHLGNGVDSPQVSNPAYKVAALSYNLGASTGTVLKVADMMSGLEGITNRNNFPGGTAVIQTSLTQNDLHHVISISNPLVFNNTINTREVLLQDLTVTTQCNDPATVYLFLDGSLSSGVQDFQSQNGFSVSVSKATGLMDINTNFPILSFIVGITGSTTQFALEPYRIVVPPGSTMNIAISSTAVLQKAAAAISWYND